MGTPDAVVAAREGPPDDAPVPERKATLAEMIALADADLDNALAMKMARGLWNRPNSADEDRALVVRRAILSILQLFAQNEAAIRAALRKRK